MSKGKKSGKPPMSPNKMKAMKAGVVKKGKAC